jgi:exonuclease VII small subunit
MILKKNKTNKKHTLITVFFTMVIFLITMSVPVIAQITETKPSPKEEVVYGNLSSSGKVKDIYVVNVFEAESAGEITDYGDYSSVTNLTSAGKIKNDGGMITARIKEGRFYYKGKIKKNELPWNIDIKYFLDGEPISTGALSGAAGNVRVQIKTERNQNVDPSYFENYMLQISMELDAEKCKNIKASGGTFANSGNNKMVSFSIMPGKEGIVSLTTDSSAFGMDGIDITALPFSAVIDIPDISSLEKGMTSIVYGIEQLEQGVTEFQKGLKKIDSGSSQLISSSEKIKNALQTINNSLAAGQGGFDAETLGVLADALDNANGTLGDAINEIPADDLEQEDLDSLISALTYARDAGQATEEDMTNLDKLINTYDKAQIVKSIYGSSDVSEVFVSSSLALGGAGEGIEDLQQNISLLNEKYSLFHLGLVSYSEGISESARGSSALKEGAAELYQKTSGIPSLISEKIESAISEYDKSDYRATSFVSKKNTKVSMVQFVIRADGIEKKDNCSKCGTADKRSPGKNAGIKNGIQGITERFKALF